MSDKSILKRIFESTTSQDLSLAVLDFTTAISFDTQLSYISIKFSSTVSESITISIDANTGTSYDVTISKSTMAAKQQFFYQPDAPLYLKKGSEIRVQCTNAGASGTAFVVVAQVQA